MSRTPEPPGEEHPAGGSSFCIPKHAAARLRDDFGVENTTAQGGSGICRKGADPEPLAKRIAGAGAPT